MATETEVVERSTETGYPHITHDKYGRPSIVGLRMRVLDVVCAYKHYGSVETVAEHYPPVTLVQIHAALTYYYDHQDEIDAEFQADVDESERGYARQVLPPKLREAAEQMRRP